MHAIPPRPLLAVLTAGTVLILLGACGGSDLTPAAAGSPGAPGTPSANASTSPGPVGTSAKASPGRTGGTQGGGGGGQPKPAANAVKACDLVTATEAAAAIRSANLKTQTSDAEDCDYSTADGSADVTIVVQAVPFTADLPNAIVELAPAQARRVDGLGDAAVLFTPVPGQAQFHFWKSGRYVVIAVTAGPTLADTAAVNLGRTAAGRL